jgi:predicted LPLAT superfamily acyltransferase
MVVNEQRIVRCHCGTGRKITNCTPEEIDKVKAPLSRGDNQGFYDVLTAMDKGLIQFIGVSQTNVHFNLAVEEKTEKGKRVLLIADEVDDDGRIARVVLGDAGLHFADEISTYISSLCVDSATRLLRREP